MLCEGRGPVSEIHNKRLLRRLKNMENERPWSVLTCSVTKISRYRTVGLITEQYVGLQHED
jgi:hypothetical protein